MAAAPSESFATPSLSADVVNLLIVGALSWNPERIRSLRERGHRLWGLWSRSMAWDQGPYPSLDGQVTPVALADAARTIRHERIDCVYSLFQAYHPRLWGASAPGVDYSGALFTSEVDSTDALGLYWLNGSGSGLTPLSEFIVSASDGSFTAVDNEMYGVDVVPEPASLAALSIGLAAIARKRRKA